MSRGAYKRRRSGFTVIEALVVIAITSLMAAAALPFMGTFQQSETARSLSEDILHTLVRAQSRALAGDQDMRWGVRILSGSYVLYAGDSYAARFSPRDEAHEVPLPALFGGQREFTFDTVLGRPAAGGVLTVTGPEETAIDIHVNAAGGIFLTP